MHTGTLRQTRHLKFAASAAAATGKGAEKACVWVIYFRLGLFPLSPPCVCASVAFARPQHVRSCRRRPPRATLQSQALQNRRTRVHTQALKLPGPAHARLLLLHADTVTLWETDYFSLQGSAVLAETAAAAAAAAAPATEGKRRQQLPPSAGLADRADSRVVSVRLVGVCAVWL